MNHWNEVTYSLAWASASMLASLALDEALSQPFLIWTGLFSIGLFIFVRASGESVRLAYSSRLHPFFLHAFEVPFWLGFFTLVRAFA